MDIFRLGLLGAASGGAIGLIALGLVLVYRTSGVLNFSAGAVGAFSAYVFSELRDEQGVYWAIALVAGLATGAALSTATQLLLSRLRAASPLAKAIATLGVMTILMSLATALWGDQERLIGSVFPSSAIGIGGGLAVGRDRLILAGVAIALAIVLRAAYKYTSFGLATTAVAEQRLAATSFGWSAARIELANWAIAGVLSALAGIVVAPLVGLQATTLTFLVVPALAAALVGSFASFAITTGAAILLGAVQTALAQEVQTPGLAASIPFFVILAVIVVGGKARPTRGDLPTRLPLPGPGKVRLPTAVVFTGAMLILIWTLGSTYVDAINTTLTMGILVLSIVVVTGYAGQLSLCQWALAGMGAWVSGRLNDVYGWPFWFCAIIGIGGAMVAGLVVALPALRTRGVNLAVATLGLASIILAMIFNNPDLTGGSAGTTIHAPSFFGISLNDVPYPQRYATMTLIIFLLVLLLTANMRRGRIGLRLLSVRSNERAAASLGIGVYGAKLYAFSMAAGIAAVAGILTVFRFQYVDYTQFDVNTSILAVTWAVIGGVGWASGALVGALGSGGSIVGTLVTNWLGSTSAWSTTLLPIAGGAGAPVVLAESPDGIAAAQHQANQRLAARLRPRRPRSDRPVTPPVTATRAAVPPPLRRARPELSIRNLSVSYGAVRALKDVSFEVHGSEVVGLIGPNGAGKTTLLDAVTGLTRITGGHVLLNGRPIDSWSPTRRARAGLARSFQGVDLFEELSVRDNLLVATDRHAWRRYVIDLVHPDRLRPTERMESVVADFGLEKWLGARPAELPAGVMRRVGVARAMIAEPSVLFLDEPMAGLDVSERLELGEEVRSIAGRQGLAVVLVEHDVQLVLRTCDRIVVLDFGSKIAEGTPAEIRNEPAVIAAYLGVAQAEAAGAETLTKSEKGGDGRSGPA